MYACALTDSSGPQAELPSSIHFAERRFYEERTRTTQPLLISKRASRSNLLQLVSNYQCRPQTNCSHLHADLELDEEGTRISLTIVDTPGFGDQIDNESR